MKAYGQAIGPPAVRHGKPRSAGHDKYEAQAVDVARRFVRGEGRLARRLTPVRAADLTVASSRGEALPSPVRQELEQGFGADLSAVRIHRDAAADAAAQAHGARAFASGPDIFFANGAFDPTGDSGRALIAHEIVHVLQQTAREATGGRRRATAQRGAGAIQAVEEVPIADDAVPELRQVFDWHLDALAGTPDRDRITALRQAADAAPSTAEFWATRETHVLHRTEDPVLGAKPDAIEPGALACLYDALKVTGRLDGAVRLLHDHPDVKTLFLSQAAYVAYLESFEFDAIVDRINAIWTTSPLFAGLRPADVIDRMLQYLLGPTRARSRQQKGAGKGAVFLDEVAYAEWGRVSKVSGKPKENETYVAAMRVIGEFELFRTVLVERVDRALTPGNKMERKKEAAYRLRAWADEQLRARQKWLAAPRQTRGAFLETVHLMLRDFLPALVRICDLAIAFWTMAEKTAAGAAIEGTGVTPAELTGGIAADPFFAPFRGAMLGVADGVLFRHPDERLPEPGDYDARRKTARNAFALAVHQQFETTLAAMFRAPVERAKKLEFPKEAITLVDRLRLARIAWVLGRSAELLHVLEAYSKNADEAFVKRIAAFDPKSHALDFRLAHRIRVARRIAGVASTAGWPELAGRVAPVLTATEIAGGKTQPDNVLAFVSDWTLDATAPVSRLGFEAAGSDIVGWEPLTIGELVTFYQARGYRQLTDQIGASLGAEAGKYELKQEPLLNRAYQSALALERPRRYFMPDWEAAFAVDRAGTPITDRSTLQQMIRDHPLTRQLLEREERRLGHPPAGIVPPRQERHAVVWLLPPPVALVERLQTNDALNEFIERFQRLPVELIHSPGAAGSPAYLAEPLARDEIADLPWYQWWHLFRGALGPHGKLTPDEQRRVEARQRTVREALDRMGLRASLETERELERQALEDALRLGLAHERKRRERVAWIPILERYRPTVSITKMVRIDREQVPIRRLPIEVMESILLFLVDAPDAESRDAHLAMALIEMSEVLQRKLWNATDTDVLFHWAPALEWALERHKKGDLEKFRAKEDQQNTSLIPEGIKRLDALLTRMEEVVAEDVTRYGIVGVPGEGTIEDTGFIRPLGRQRRLDYQTPFTIDGRTWQIVEVLAPFTFHPGPWVRGGRPSKVASSLLKVGEGDYKTEDQRGTTPLMRISVDDGDVIEVNEQSPLLTDLAWSAMRYAIHAQLSELAEAMESVAALALDLAELFPGVGPAVAATRLVIAATAFFKSDLPDLLEELVKNPGKLLDEVRAELDQVLEPSRLLEYFLFRGEGFSAGAKKPRPVTSRTARGSRSKALRRVLTRLRTIGLGLVNSFGRLQARVEHKREAAQMFVMSRPALLRVLSEVADHYWVLNQLPSLASAANDVRKDAGAFVGNLHETLNSLGEVELPEKLLTFEDIFNVAIDVVGYRLGGKYRLGVQILLRLLDFIGARQEIVAAIASAVRQVADERRLLPMWQETFIPIVRDGLHRAQVALQTTLNEPLNALQGALGDPDLDLQIPTPEARPQVAGDEFPEAQPFGPAREGPLALAPGALADGRPLAPGARADAEARFGHDLGHVRVHTGAAAHRLNRAVGAHALTTGSHVLLSNAAGANPVDRSPVLRHELAHVIQQTGPRPLGRPADPTPRVGRPGGGVAIDGARERAAGRAAAAAGRGYTHAPLDVGHAPDSDWQPALIDQIGHKFLRYLVGYEDIEADVARTDRPLTKRLIARNVRDAVRDVGASLMKKIRADLAIHTSVRGTFAPVKDLIVAHLDNQKEHITGAIRELAIQSSDPVAGKAGGATNRPQMRLNVFKLEAKLNRYIFGKTGVLLDIELQKNKKPGDITLNRTDPIKSVTLRFLHLAPIAGNSRLWRDAMLKKSTALGTDDLNDTQRAELRPRVRQVLREKGPIPSVWVDGDFRLSYSVYKRVEEIEKMEVTAGTAGHLPPAALTERSVYLAAKTPSTHAVDTNVGHIGLRLGTYADREGGEQRGKERESHHITQYLLAAYFHNGKASTVDGDPHRRAFKIDLKEHPDAYPGLTPDAAGLAELFVVDNNTVRIAATEDKRGAAMPTISLARPTHRTRSLHITPNADDFGDPQQTTQAGALNKVFEDALSAKYKELETKAAKDKNDGPDWQAWEAWKKDHSADVQREIYAGMQHTYRALRNYMVGRLETGLETRELEYYNDLSDAVPRSPASDWTVTVGDMRDVYKRAVSHNDATLLPLGWTGKG